jgi:hypothetical protein
VGFTLHSAQCLANICRDPSCGFFHDDVFDTSPYYKVAGHDA